MEIRKAIPYKNDPKISGYDSIEKFLLEYGKNYLLNVKLIDFEEITYDDKFLYILDKLKQGDKIEKALIHIMKEKGIEVLSPHKLNFDQDSSKEVGVIHLKEGIDGDKTLAILEQTLLKYEKDKEIYLKDIKITLESNTESNKIIISNASPEVISSLTHFMSGHILSDKNEDLDHPHPSPYIRLRYCDQNNRKGFFYQISEHCL